MSRIAAVAPVLPAFAYTQAEITAELAPLISTVPGKRAATVAECESDHTYVPLNDGDNWKGDPNATWTNQDIPQFPPGTAPAPRAVDVRPPIAIAEYNPATGSYTGPDGRSYTQTDLGRHAGDQTWQSMLAPPGQ